MDADDSREAPTIIEPSPAQELAGALVPLTIYIAVGSASRTKLTGVPAVAPGEIPAMLQEVSVRMPIQPSTRAQVDPQVEAVLAVAVAKSPVHRFATSSQLAYAFDQAVQAKLERGIAHRAEALLEEQPWARISGNRPVALVSRSDFG